MLTVSCESCGRQFRNIKPEMSGKKAKCPCGAIVWLGAGDPPSNSEKRNQGAADLLNVDLMGDEMLGDQLLEAEQFEHNPEPHPTDLPDTIQNPAKQKLSKQKPSKSRSSREKTKSQRLDRKTHTGGSSSENAQRDKPRNNRTGRSKKTNSKRNSRRQPAPEVPLTVSPSKPRSKSKSQRPIYEQTYGDLDAILEGAGDAKPIMVRPQSVPTPEPVATVARPGSEVSSENTASKRKPSTLGFLAALGSATLAIWFGLFVAVSRFHSFDSFLMSGFSTQLRSLYRVDFGDSKVPGVFELVFSVLGWLLWCVAIVIVLVAIAQFINAFVNLISEQQPVGWSDGLIGALGVCAVFLLVAIVFCESSFATHEHQTLDAYEQPFADEGEQLENVTRLRAVIDNRNRMFTIYVLGMATIPMAVFILSMVRLFAKASEKSSQSNVV